MVSLGDGRPYHPMPSASFLPLFVNGELSSKVLSSREGPLM